MTWISISERSFALAASLIVFYVTIELVPGHRPATGSMGWSARSAAERVLTVVIAGSALCTWVVSRGRASTLAWAMASLAIVVVGYGATPRWRRTASWEAKRARDPRYVNTVQQPN
jgi:cytochrome c-type biogenesis protein CcmH/NrfG